MAHRMAHRIHPNLSVQELAGWYTSRTILHLPCTIFFWRSYFQAHTLFLLYISDTLLLVKRNKGEVSPTSTVEQC